MHNLYCNEATFTTIYINNHQKLINFLYKKCGCKCESEDLAQEAFFKFWKNRGKVEKGKETSYLFTIANNLFIDKTRRNKVRMSYRSSISFMQEERTPEYVLRMKEQEIKLQENISSMPEKSREVFVMNKLNDMTYNEIASSLELSVKAIEKRMSKALHIFRQLNVAS
jgi:RNA polymerase sigma-70 factor (ECF subfamily)